MGKTYSQLTLDERIEIFRLQSDGKSHREIGRMMGRHHSTIMRELGRNGLQSGYKPAMADHMAWARQKRSSKLERLRPLQLHVVDRLAMGWSPEQIAGRLRREKAEHWRRDYNEVRPHSAIGNKSPIALINRDPANSPPIAMKPENSTCR